MHQISHTYAPVDSVIDALELVKLGSLTGFGSP